MCVWSVSSITKAVIQHENTQITCIDVWCIDGKQAIGFLYTIEHTHQHPSICKISDVLRRHLSVFCTCPSFFLSKCFVSFLSTSFIRSIQEYSSSTGRWLIFTQSIEKMVYLLIPQTLDVRISQTSCLVFLNQQSITQDNVHSRSERKPLLHQKPANNQYAFWRIHTQCISIFTFL